MGTDEDEINDNEDNISDLSKDEIKAMVERYFESNAPQKPVNPARETRVVDCSFEFECPRDWGSLQSTQATNVRFCGQCQEKVFYCRSDLEIKMAKYAGLCVAAVVMREGERKVTFGVPSSRGSW